jgi:5-methylcytosine-specific restriction protein B
LRRRFGFIELMPSYKALINELGIDNVESEKEAIDKIRSWNDLNDIKKLAVKVLYTINEKIRKIYDRDHQIGHSYLLKLKDCKNEIETLRYIWFHEIIPLLQEYFYDSPEKLRQVLGNFVEVDGDSYEFIDESTLSDEEFISKLRELCEESR